MPYVLDILRFALTISRYLKTISENIYFFSPQALIKWYDESMMKDRVRKGQGGDLGRFFPDICFTSAFAFTMLFYKDGGLSLTQIELGKGKRKFASLHLE